MRRFVTGGLLFATLLATAAWDNPRYPYPYPVPPPEAQPAPSAPTAPAIVDRNRVSLELTRALHDLGELESQLAYGYDRDDARRELGEIRDRLRTLQALVAAAPAPRPDRGPVVGWPGDHRMPIDAATLDAAMRRIAQTWSPEQKLTVVEDLARRGWFTVGQVRRVAGLFWSDEDKLRAIDVLAPRVLDPENAGALEPILGYGGARARLRATFHLP